MCGCSLFFEHSVLLYWRLFKPSSTPAGRLFAQKRDGGKLFSHFSIWFREFFFSYLLNYTKERGHIYWNAPLLVVQPDAKLYYSWLYIFLRSGKKRLFPRFHFTSEADLLDILSNGNQPSKIMRHIDKLMLSTSTLVLESVPGNVSDRPRAVRFKAGVGNEIIDFEPAVFLEGKVNLEHTWTNVLFCRKRAYNRKTCTKYYFV